MIKLKSLLIKESYIGSCVDVANNKKLISNIFTDATQMAQVVNPDGYNFLQVTPETFYKYFNVNKIPDKAKRGTVEYYRIKNDRNNNPLDEEECGLWWIYNVDHDIHYFFRR